MRIVKFNRNENEWPMWSKKFMAVAKKKFVDIINETMTVPKWSENISKEDMAIRNLNQAAIVLHE